MATETFSVVFRVSQAMERRYTKEEIELAAKVDFFSALSLEEEYPHADLAKDQELTLTWSPMIRSRGAYKIILVQGKVSKHPQEESSAKAQD